LNLDWTNHEEILVRRKLQPRKVSIGYSSGSISFDELFHGSIEKVSIGYVKDNDGCGV